MPPPAQCTIQASRMMARMIRTSHAKNNAIPGMAYPLMVLVLATTASYPPMPDLIDRLTEACGAGDPAAGDAHADGDAAAGVPGLRRREQPAVPGLALARDDRHAPRRPLALGPRGSSRVPRHLGPCPMECWPHSMPREEAEVRECQLAPLSLRGYHLTSGIANPRAPGVLAPARLLLSPVVGLMATWLVMSGLSCSETRPA